MKLRDDEVKRLIGHLRLLVSEEVTHLFERFVQMYQQTGELLTIGRYEITGRVRLRRRLTVRVDIDEIETATGKAHVVTVYFGGSGDESVVNVEVG